MTKDYTQKLAGPILVVVDHEGSQDKPVLTKASGKVLRLARKLTAGKVHVQSLEPQADLAALAENGADVVYLPESDGYSPRVAAQVAEVSREALSDMGDPSAVLTVGTFTGRSLSAILGVSLRVAAAVEVTDVWVQGDQVVAEKSALGGSWVTKFEATEGFPILSLRLGSGFEGEVEAGDAAVTPLAVAFAGPATSVEVLSSTREAPGSRISLNDAEVVVVGGRGVDGDFTIVEELADMLGGAVGSTRVACDEGWAPRSTQIGQTGVSVSPKLYLGLGVSGAVHHTCGMLASEVIVAIVDDPDAPIVEMADFVVVGNVADVVPQALDALKARAGAA